MAGTEYTDTVGPNIRIIDTNYYLSVLVDDLFSVHWNEGEHTFTTVTFTATRYLPPYTPHVGPLDPVTFKEAPLFICIRVH